MAGKKTNRGSRKKAAASPRHKQNQSKEIEGRKRVPAQQNPCDRVSFVRPLWESLNEKAKLELLTVDLNELRARVAGHAEKAVSARRSTTEVAQVSAEAPVDGVLPKDLKRLEDQGTWKVWRWGKGAKPYTEAEAFRREAKVEADESEGVTGLFTPTEDGVSVTVNPGWLQHLQERRLSEVGQPQKIKEGEDPHKVGLVLDWLYGSLAAPAEKAEDGAKRPLGSSEPSVRQAHEKLLTAQRNQKDLETRSKSAKEILQRLLVARRDVAEVAKHCKCAIPNRESHADTANLPDEMIWRLLKREELLARAKLHLLHYERTTVDSGLRTLRAELMQDKSRFEGSKGGPDQGATASETANREQAMKVLQNWQRNVNQLAAKFNTVLNPERTGDIEEEGQADNEDKKAADEQVLENLRITFHRHFKNQLYSDLDDQTFFSKIKRELKEVNKRLEDGAIMIQHLEMWLINGARDDQEAAIGGELILPLLQERLDREAMEYATKKASLAEEDVLRLEEEEAERLQATAAKKKQQKKKKKDKLRKAKARKANELQAEEQEVQAALEEHLRKTREKEEEERKRKEAELEKLREAEEAQIKQRRQELLSEENGYWKRRTEEDARLKEAVRRLMAPPEGPPPTRTKSCDLDSRRVRVGRLASRRHRSVDFEGDGRSRGANSASETGQNVRNGHPRPTRYGREDYWELDVPL